MISRREWLRKAAIIAGGAIAADQLELIERLTPRLLIPGWSPNYVTATEILKRKTLAEFAMSQHWSKLQKDMYEMFQQTNTMLEDILWTEGNSFAGHPSLPQAPLPLINWKSLSG